MVVKFLLTSQDINLFDFKQIHQALFQQHISNGAAQVNKCILTTCNINYISDTCNSNVHAICMYDNECMHLHDSNYKTAVHVQN